MRAAILTAALLAVAAPAAAQIGLEVQRADLEAQLSAMRQREVILRNELSTLDAQVRTEQGLRQLEAQRDQPRLRLPSDPRATSRQHEPRGMASIPDGRLAASNARIRDAARNSR